jgi:hypothetical protein
VQENQCQECAHGSVAKMGADVRMYMPGRHCDKSCCFFFFSNSSNSVD